MRFSLRTFLIVVAIITVWIGWYANRAERQRAAVRWVQEHDGVVFYGYEVDSYPNMGLDKSPSSVFVSQPLVPEWLLKILDINYFSDIVEVDLSSTKVSDIALLAGLTKFEDLNLNDTQISEEEIGKLQRALPNCKISR